MKISGTVYIFKAVKELRGGAFGMCSLGLISTKESRDSRYSCSHPSLDMASAVITRELFTFSFMKESQARPVYPRQDSENGPLFSQAVGRACPILAALCFLKQRAHFLIATPEEKKRTERTIGATLSAKDGILRPRWRV